MKASLVPPVPQANRLLARLPPQEYQRLAPHLSLVTMRLHEVLYDFQSLIEYIYFPLQSILSALTVMRDGRSIEIANIGREGAAGLAVLTGAARSPNRMIVQFADGALRIRAEVLRKIVDRDGPLRTSLLEHQAHYFVQVSQAVACNGLHSIEKRCCRWLLMTHDRLDTDVLPLTHEFLAMMLGVRRAGITEVLRTLQEKKLIKCSRGKITIRDRSGLEKQACECYQIIKQEYYPLL
ncbi:Crp/Fnr family transcriptional regulator [Candidatus Laterigemmans baculatus]|uniref:Crp/Fnr family transcriptional regulator n=1 Tax=Candidatus Laterigemmans baculatus TaxID=2770505 RepID=UPI0013DC2E68|nr:Crp/Fnr family transcriptional regulator [Candidatus Laterigemmans baculatus]